MITYLVLLVVASSSSLETMTTVKDQKVWLQAHHRFDISPILEEYKLVGKEVPWTLSKMDEGIKASLGKLLSFHAKELQRARLKFPKDKACFQNEESEMKLMLNAVVDDYKICTEPILLKMSRISKDLANFDNRLHALADETYKQLDTCVDLYEDKAPLETMLGCMDGVLYRYSVMVNDDMITGGSRAMKVFENIVATCVEPAAQNVTAEGAKFLQRLTACSRRVSRRYTYSPAHILEQQIASQGSPVNLTGQIKAAQLKAKEVVMRIKTFTLKFVYGASKYRFVDSTDRQFFLTSLKSTIEKHNEAFTIVGSASIVKTCVKTAKQALDSLLELSADIYMKDHKKLSPLFLNVEKTLHCMIIYLADNDIPTIGDIAILQCFAEGYFFDVDAIKRCFDLKLSYFHRQYSRLEKIGKDNYAGTERFKEDYFGRSNPETNVETDMLMEADRILYNMERCFYIDSEPKSPFGTNIQ